MGFLLFLRALIRSLADKRTATKLKILFGIVLIYLLSPVDIISDVIPIVGFLDDGTIGLSGLAIIRKLLDDEIYNEYYDEYKNQRNYWILLLILGFFMFWGLIIVLLISII